MIKNIIFDWSGTLSDDSLLVYEGCMAIFDKFKVKRLSLEEFKREFELPYMDFHKKYIPKLKKAEADKIFLEAIEGLGMPKPFPKVKEVLEDLKNKGIKMIVLSSNPQENLDKEAEEYGFSKYFLGLYGWVHDKREKITELMEKYDFKKEETLYLGDMIHDIETGKKAGVVTVAISWGYQSKEKLMKVNPDYLINNIEELNEILGKA